MISLPVREMILIELLTFVSTLMVGKIHVSAAPFYIRQGYTTSHGDELVSGNEFLERCLVNNAFSDLDVALNDMVMIKSRGGRNRVLHAIAGWLEEFIANNRRARLHHGSSRVTRFRQRIKRAPFIGMLAANLYYRAIHHLFPLRKRRLVRFGEIEPYILA